MDFAQGLDFPSTFWLMIAPPAWGKTHQLLSLLTNSPDTLFVFISPLRALANEFYGKTKDQYSVLLITESQSWKNFSERHQLVIVTPETCGNSIEMLSASAKKILFVLDEFHLYFYWGTTFREIMWECLINVLVTEQPVLALTATLAPEQEVFFLEQMKNQVHLVIKMNYGNQKLLHLPKQSIFIPKIWKDKSDWLVQHELEKSSRGCVLFFVAFRSDVDRFKVFFENQGYLVLTCVGGEASLFADQLKKNPAPDLIISTTVLSHGVNLPQIRAVIFNYKLNNLDFWVQMVGRGGRKGEKYFLYSHDLFSFTRWRMFISLVKLTGILGLRFLFPWNESANQN
ncbi:MAG: DEAD/DEAH box helicase [Bacteriovoracaceae bacterium]